MEKGARVIVTARVESGYDSDHKAESYSVEGGRPKPDTVPLHDGVEVYYDPANGELPSIRWWGRTGSMHKQSRKLYRMQEDHWEGLVIGWTTRRTGIKILHPDYGENTYGELREIKDFKVWLVTPADSDRWTEPVACLEDDLLLIQEYLPQVEGEPGSGMSPGLGEFPPSSGSLPYEEYVSNTNKEEK